MPKMSIAEKIDACFCPNDAGVSKWVDRGTVSSDVKDLGNNGVFRNGVLLQDNRYIWETQRASSKPKSKILKIRTAGLNPDGVKSLDRPIRDDIHKLCKAKKCVFCGSSADVTDHKNDLYNDPRVLDAKTQVLEDFQPVCTHCNLLKRQKARDRKSSEDRQSAQDVPQIAALFPGLHFTAGNGYYYDEQDPNALLGTYWYDPIAFILKAQEIRDSLKLEGSEMTEETVAEYQSRDSGLSAAMEALSVL